MKYICGKTCGVAAIAAACLLPYSARADVKLPALIGDGMVLQRSKPIHLYGTADPGEAIKVSIAGETGKATAGADGAWDVRLKPLPAGGPFTLTVSGKNTIVVQDILVGEVWVCSGQSNMEFPLRQAATGVSAIAASANPLLHLFHVNRSRSDAPLADVQGKWAVAGPGAVPNFPAVGYYFGRDLQKDLNVPIGLIESDWGGTPGEAWTPESALTHDDYLKKTYVEPNASAQARYQKQLADFPAAVAAAQVAGKTEPKKPVQPWRFSELYNGMIAPLTGYTIAGATWYQGEANRGNPAGYRKLLPALIRSWRAAWNEPDFPFLIVQIAPHGYGKPLETNAAELREAQWETAQTVGHAGMVVTADVGNSFNIHPTKKEPVGDRLALLARRIVYGENVAAFGPTLKDARRDGANVVLHFDNVGSGLLAKAGVSSTVPIAEGTLAGFFLAGADGKPVAAEAKITGRDTIVVSSALVPEPTMVSYDFVNFTPANLYNAEGLPAVAFRTDVK